MAPPPGVAPGVVLVSDLDHTMVDHGDSEHTALLAFNSLWKKHMEADSVLVFNTGRSLTLFLELQNEAPLLMPDALICSVGTEIFNRVEGSWQVDKEWELYLEADWDRSVMLGIGNSIPELTLQPESEQRPHKISYNVDGEKGPQAVQQLEKGIADSRLKAKVIYSGGMDVDVLAVRSDKGDAVQFLLSKLEKQGLVPSRGILVCGDSGNDIGMFKVKGARGCVVSNAHAELRDYCLAQNSRDIHMATKRCAGGIMEALQHFGWLPDGAQIPKNLK